MSTAPSRPLIKGWSRITERVPKSRQQLWRDIRKGKFPAPIELGENTVAWYADEINAWEASRRRRIYKEISPAGAREGEQCPEDADEQASAAEYRRRPRRRGHPQSAAAPSEHRPPLAAPKGEQ